METDDVSQKERLAKRRDAYRNMPRDKYLAMRARENESAKKRRDSETPEQREARLAPMRERARKRLASETPEQREKRLACQRAQKPKYRARNLERLRANDREYYKKNRDRIIEYGKAYRRQNTKTVALRCRVNRAANPQHAISGRMRCRLRNALTDSGVKKVARTFDLVGCSPKDLMAWLESQFMPGMGWHNRSLWHVDHIIPLNAFDLSCGEQQRVAFHYTNLRPLWAAENVAKRDRIPVPQKKFFWTLRDIAEARRRVASRGLASA
jgi:hypothetical protein